jgi:predicted PurR-regulated permease PerM
MILYAAVSFYGSFLLPLLTGMAIQLVFLSPPMLTRYSDKRRNRDASAYLMVNACGVIVIALFTGGFIALMSVIFGK